MPVELANSIEELQTLWPLNGDYILEGDDHLRLIKSLLAIQFPGSSGDGFSTPITVSEAELNYVGGLQSNLQSQINSIGQLPYPVGTRVLFYAASAPYGWERDTETGNFMVMAVGVSDPENPAATTGGDYEIITKDFSHIHSGLDYALVMEEIPPVTIEVRFDADGQGDGHTQTDRVARGRDDGGDYFTAPIRQSNPGDAHPLVVESHAETTFPMYSNWLACIYSGITELPQLPPVRTLGAFFTTTVTVGQSPITNTNYGYETISPGNIYGSVTETDVLTGPKAGWTLRRIGDWYNPGPPSKGNVFIGFDWEGAGQDPDVMMPNDDEEGWCFMEIEYDSGVTKRYFERDGTGSGEPIEMSVQELDVRDPPTCTQWGSTPDQGAGPIGWQLPDVSDVRVYDWRTDRYTSVPATVGNIRGFVKDVQGSISPDTTPRGQDIYGLWYDSSTEEIVFAIVGDAGNVEQSEFGGIHAWDTSDAKWQEFPLKSYDATFSYKTDGTYDYAEWRWLIGTTPSNQMNTSQLIKIFGANLTV